MFANISMELAKREKALIIPESALAYDASGAFVWLVGAEEKVQRRTVAVGIREGDRLEILSGLRRGDRVVVGGTHKVVEGSKVVHLWRGTRRYRCDTCRMSLSQICIDRPVLSRRCSP